VRTLPQTPDRSFARAYFKAASQTVNAPWSIAVGGDFAYERTTGKKPLGTDLLNWYIDQVVKAGQQHDGEVVIRLNETLALLRGPQTIMAPAFVLRVLRAARQRTDALRHSCGATPAAASAPPS